MTGNEHNFKIGDNVIVICQCQECKTEKYTNMKAVVTGFYDEYIEITNNVNTFTYEPMNLQKANSHIIKSRLGVK